MRLRGSLCLMLGFAAAGCVDFGAEIDPSVDAGLVEAVVPGADSGVVSPGVDGGGASCVEGPTEPTTDGPQLRYVGLNVDQRLVVAQVGDVVTWTNGDTMRHSVVAGAPGAEIPASRGGFNSGEFGSGAKFAYRFCTARSVVYFCSTHPSQMNGYRIVVE